MMPSSAAKETRSRGVQLFEMDFASPECSTSNNKQLKNARVGPSQHNTPELRYQDMLGLNLVKETVSFNRTSTNESPNLGPRKHLMVSLDARQTGRSFDSSQIVNFQVRSDLKSQQNSDLGHLGMEITEQSYTSKRSPRIVTQVNFKQGVLEQKRYQTRLTSEESDDLVDDSRILLKSDEQRVIEAVWDDQAKERFLSQTQLKFLGKIDNGYKRDHKMFKGSPKKPTRPFQASTQKAIYDQIQSQMRQGQHRAQGPQLIFSVGDSEYPFIHKVVKQTQMNLELEKTKSKKQQAPFAVKKKKKKIPKTNSNSEFEKSQIIISNEQIDPQFLENLQSSWFNNTDLLRPENIYIVSLDLKSTVDKPIAAPSRNNDDGTHMIQNHPSPRSPNDESAKDIHSLAYSQDNSIGSPPVHRPIFDAKYEARQSSMLKADYQDNYKDQNLEQDVNSIKATKSKEVSNNITSVHEPLKPLGSVSRVLKNKSSGASHEKLPVRSNFHTGLGRTLKLNKEYSTASISPNQSPSHAEISIMLKSDIRAGSKMTSTQTYMKNNSTPEPRVQQTGKRGATFNADLKEWVSQCGPVDDNILVKKNASASKRNPAEMHVQIYNASPIRLNESTYSGNKHTLNIDSASRAGESAQVVRNTRVDTQNNPMSITGKLCLGETLKEDMYKSVLNASTTGQINQLSSQQASTSHDYFPKQMKNQSTEQSQRSRSPVQSRSEFKQTADRSRTRSKSKEIPHGSPSNHQSRSKLATGLRNLKVKQQQRYQAQRERKQRINFDDNEPIMIAKAAPIQTYWSKPQQKKCSSTRIVIEAQAEGFRQIFTSIHSPSPSALGTVKDNSDLKDVEHKLKYELAAEMLKSQHQLIDINRKEAIKVKVFDVPRFSSTQNKTSAEYLEKPTLNQASTPRIGLANMASTRLIFKAYGSGQNSPTLHSPHSPTANQLPVTLATFGNKSMYNQESSTPGVGQNAQPLKKQLVVKNDAEKAIELKTVYGSLNGGSVSNKMMSQEEYTAKQFSYKQSREDNYHESLQEELSSCTHYNTSLNQEKIDHRKSKSQLHHHPQIEDQFIQRKSIPLYHGEKIGPVRVQHQSEIKDDTHLERTTPVLNGFQTTINGVNIGQIIDVELTQKEKQQQVSQENNEVNIAEMAQYRKYESFINKIFENKSNRNPTKALATSQTFTKHIRWDKIDYTKMMQKTSRFQNKSLQKSQNVNCNHDASLRMSLDDCLRKTNRVKPQLTQRHSKIHPFRRSYVGVAKHELSLTNMQAPLHPFHHSYVEKQHIADKVFESDAVQFTSPMHMQLKPLINYTTDNKFLTETQIAMSIDTHTGTQSSQVNDPTANKQDSNRQFVHRNDSELEAETTLAMYNVGTRVTVPISQNIQELAFQPQLAANDNESNNRVGNSRIGGGIVVNPGKNLVLPEASSPHVTRSRLSSLNKNVYRQLRDLASPSKQALADSRLSRGKERIMGMSTERASPNSNQGRRQPCPRWHRASRDSKVDSNNLNKDINKDIAMSTENSYHEISPLFSVNQADSKRPRGYKQVAGFFTNPKQSREAFNGLVQLSEHEKDELETPGHHVLFPVLSNQSSVLQVTTTNPQNFPLGPMKKKTARY